MRRPAAVEHADAVDALLERDGLHHLVGVLAMVGEHGVPGGAGDAVRELVGAQDHGVQQVLLLGLHVIRPEIAPMTMTMTVSERTSFCASRPGQSNQDLKLYYRLKGPYCRPLVSPFGASGRLFLTMSDPTARRS